jgi:hypothetical protein
MKKKMFYFVANSYIESIHHDAVVELSPNTSFMLVIFGLLKAHKEILLYFANCKRWFGRIALVVHSGIYP